MPRGGKRQGAGRKVGAQSAKTVQRLALADKAAASGQTPLEVMLDNMRHFHNVALDAEAVLEAMAAEDLAGNGIEPADQFKAMLAEVKKAAGLRQMAQGCASDAAPYLHHKLSAVEHTGKDGEPLIPELSLADTARRLAFLLTSAARSQDKP